MAAHVFGGDWTSDKLDRVRKYLCAYTTIFKKNPRARHFTTIYVDAFAGTGYRVQSKQHSGRFAGIRWDSEEAQDARALQKGSARIALDVDPPFDRLLFVERSAKRINELEALRNQFRERADTIQIEKGDANKILTSWCQQTDWKKHRAVVFLDPYGMQVDWATIEAIAATEAIDLWLLFPIGVAVNRLLTKKSLPPKPWADALTRIFGDDSWRQEFYTKKSERTLFGEKETERKEADFDRIGRYFLKRLQSVFAEVAPNPLVLKNSRGGPIYLLSFAAGNPRGARTAVKIATDILR